MAPASCRRNSCHRRIPFVFLAVLVLLCSSKTIHKGKATPYTERTGHFAYATIHYDAGSESEGFLLATRVLLRSLLKTETRFDVVVLVPEATKPETEEVLTRDGAKVVKLNIKDPFARTSRTDRRAHLEHSYNKLRLWELVNYERIVYLEPENLVLYNMDDLFTCGPFCAVHINPLVYAIGLWVVTPGHNATLDLVKGALVDMEAQDPLLKGIDQGFIPRLFSAIEMGPLFEAGSHLATADGGESALVKRLPFWYNINHFFYYERRSFDIYVCTEVQGDIPGRSLSFGYTARKMYPWYWVPYVYWNLHWRWYKFRIELSNDSPYPLFLSRGGILCALFGLIPFLTVRARSSPAYRRYIAQSSVLLQKVPSQGIAMAGVIFAYALGYLCVPPYLHPTFAFALFIGYHSLGMLLLISMLLILSGFPESLFASQYWRVVKSGGCLLLVWALTQDIWTSPVSAAVFPFLALFSSCLVQYSLLKDCAKSFLGGGRGQKARGRSSEDVALMTNIN